MSDKYHVGLGLCGIYAGIFRKPNEWKDKSEVTKEALEAVAQYLLWEKKEIRFAYDGENYVLRVEPYKEETDG